jgi:sarcosine oxidase subunit alpha
MARGPYRLTYGGQIDRTRRICFSFDGKTYQGHPGDTLASALLANGVRTVARSFKFHRPRGIFTCGIEEPNALLAVGDGDRVIPSERAPMIELTDGLTARSQGGWPSVQFDIGRLLDGLAPLWAAGFYNKTFISPSWHLYEGTIRRLAGLGHAPREADPDRYELRNLHCDLLVVGGGRAGLCAALDSARAGARVVLAEQDSQFGGELAWDGSTIGTMSARAWIAQVTAELSCLSCVTLLTRTTAIASYDHGVASLIERADPGEAGSLRERFWIVRAKRVVLASGAIEQPLIFEHNDRPGIMLAGAARQYLRRYGVAVGSQVLIATNNDSAYALAKELKDAGVAVLALVDSRRSGQVPEALRAGLRAACIEWIPQAIPTGSGGFGALRSVTIGHLSSDARAIGALQTFTCDALAVSGGWAPALQLYAQAGGTLKFDARSGVLQPTSSRPDIDIVGFAAEPIPVGPRVSPRGHTCRKWVDLLHDVTVSDLELALRENYTAIEHVKRYTTVGMAADQGKTSTAATLEILAPLRGMSPSDLGHTTLRPPVTPVTLGAIAGRETGERFAPHRLLPLHDWHVGYGALMQDFGEWRRPVVYLKTGQGREDAVRREARGVREGMGLFDASSLGKIEVHGPDALEFLDRFYINDLTTLKPYRARYGLMLRETGTLFDDGTVVRLSSDRFLLTTTSSNAARVGQWLEEWHQCEWPHFRVAILPVTESWATVSLAGPRSREVLSKLHTDIDLSTAAFPHLSMREGTLAGMPARIYRVSFTGELTYEINVPTDQGLTLWEALLEAGGDALEPLGMDALMLLRLEKGFLHLGSDTDGTTVPDDVGWGKVAAAKKADFIGKRSLRLPENARTDRLQLVGLSGEGPRPIVIGSHLRVRDSRDATDGWVTSAGAAVLTGEPIALAMVRAGRARIGETVTLYDAGAPVGQARVVNAPFYDAAGDRMNA